MSNVQTLTFDVMNALCQEFAKIAESAEAVEQGLEAAGFAAWKPYERFFESYGTEDEIRIHRRCVIEEARIRLGTPYPWRFSEAERNLIIRSAFLEKLRQQREDRNGVPERELSQRYGGAEAA